MSSYRRYLDEKRDKGRPRTNRKILEDLYRPEYAKTAEEELGYLLRAYGTQFRLGKGHPAPSSAWRAERSLQDTLIDWEARFANRVHLFAGARHFVANDDPKDHVEGRTRRYLGYVSLRPRRYTADKAPIYLRYTMVAMLIPPPYMSRPRYHIITCIAGSNDGILPFRATPFFSPATFENERANQSAPCMHASLHAALLLKASLFHCNSISSMEMVTLLWQMDHAGQLPRDGGANENCLSFHDWLHKGLSLQQALTVLEHPAVRSGGVIERVTELPYQSDLPKAQSDDLEALRCLTDYLASGIPILLEITPKPPVANKRRDAALGSFERVNPTDITATGHAILLIGMRMMADPDDARWPIPDDDDPALWRIDRKELPSKFIIHDTFNGPYKLVSTSYLLKAARVKRTATDTGGEEGIRFLALLPYGTRLGIQSVRDFARTEFGDSLAHKLRTPTYVPPYRQYLNDWVGNAAPLPLPYSPTEPRYICRLMRSRQILHRYLRSRSEKAHWPFRDPSLLKNVKGILRTRLHQYQQLYDKAVMKNLESETDKTQGQVESMALHWWCVEVRIPQQFKKGKAGQMRYKMRDEMEPVASIPPFAVYCWPLNMDDSVSDAPIKIEYQMGDKATLTLRRETFDPNEIRATFGQWRPSDG